MYYSLAIYFNQACHKNPKTFWSSDFCRCGRIRKAADLPQKIGDFYTFIIVASPITDSEIQFRKDNR